MAARANTGDQRADRRVAEIVEDFLCSRACMDLPVAVIVELAGRTIANIYDYTYALDLLKVGEPATVVFIRDGQRQETTLTHEARE